MEARLFRAALLAAVLPLIMGASHQTPNFVVRAPTPQLAQEIGQAAERYRHELAVAWLGEPMPNWSQPCVMQVDVGPNLGAGGATSFHFKGGEVFGWRMSIQGSRERLLDSVLPHEITHMVLASHFRRPVPRWADEGAASSVEHPSERARHDRMLEQFLRSGRGLPFNQMFAMTEYPPDIMPLYAQGHSVVTFLVMQGGRQKFIDYLAEGMETDDWAGATKRYYGYSDLGTLQNTWVAWVRQGRPPIRPRAVPEADPDPFLLAGSGSQPPAGRAENAAPDESPYAPGRTPQGEPRRGQTLAAADPPSRTGTLPESGWRPAGTSAGPPTVPPEVLPAEQHSEPLAPQLARPQPFQQPRQVILEWSRPNGGAVLR